IAIQASLTGHLVFSTVHTNDAAGAVTRLVDMGVEPFLVASSLIGILAQRLVRVLCKDCRAPYLPAPEELKEIGLVPEDVREAGKNVRGIRDAESSKVLRQILRKDGVYLTDARAAEAGAVVGEQKTGLSREVDIPAVLGFAGVSSQDLAIATRQLATLIAAGIPLVDALTALVDQNEQPRLKRIMGVVKQKVNEGASLADALREHPKVFSELYVNMIRAGESSGALDVVLVRLADFTESQALLRNKIIGAMLYPAIMVVVGIAIVGILFVVV